jgi:hypothetical protein
MCQPGLVGGNKKIYTMDNDFIIDKVSWYTQVVGRIKTDEEIHLRFRCMISFFQNNGLTSRVILKDDDLVTDETQIKVSDLTDKGFMLIKKAHDKYLKGINRGKVPTDVSVFEKELAKLSSGSK